MHLVEDDEEERNDNEKESKEVCVTKVDHCSNTSVEFGILQAEVTAETEFKACLHDCAKDYIPEKVSFQPVDSFLSKLESSERQQEQECQQPRRCVQYPEEGSAQAS